MSFAGDREHIRRLVEEDIPATAEALRQAVTDTLNLLLSIRWHENMKMEAEMREDCTQFLESILQVEEHAKKISQALKRAPKAPSRKLLELFHLAYEISGPCVADAHFIGYRMKKRMKKWDISAFGDRQEEMETLLSRIVSRSATLLEQENECLGVAGKYHDSAIRKLFRGMSHRVGMSVSMRLGSAQVRIIVSGEFTLATKLDSGKRFGDWLIESGYPAEKDRTLDQDAVQKDVLCSVVECITAALRSNPRLVRDSRTDLIVKIGELETSTGVMKGEYAAYFVSHMSAPGRIVLSVSLTGAGECCLQLLTVPPEHTEMYDVVIHELTHAYHLLPKDWRKDMASVLGASIKGASAARELAEFLMSVWQEGVARTHELCGTCISRHGLQFRLSAVTLTFHESNSPATVTRTLLSLISSTLQNPAQTEHLIRIAKHSFLEYDCGQFCTTLLLLYKLRDHAEFSFIEYDAQGTPSSTVPISAMAAMRAFVTDATTGPGGAPRRPSPVLLSLRPEQMHRYWQFLTWISLLDIAGFYAAFHECAEEIGLEHQVTLQDNADSSCAAVLDKCGFIARR